MGTGLTGLRKLGEHTYIIDCKVCGKSEAWYGDINKYRYILKAAYRSPRGNWNYRKAYCCSWTCYIKGLLKSTAEKQV